MERETKFISFFNQKGGVGKSTLEILMASYCHNVLGLKIAILDADYPQLNIHKLREDEINLVKRSEAYQQAFASLGKPVFPIANSNPTEAVAQMDIFLDLEAGEEPYDIIFVDLPGTINTPGVLATISQLDHIFIPLIADQLVIKSSLEFGVLVNDNLIDKPNINLKTLHFFWNNVVKSEKSNLYEMTNSVIEQAGLKVLETMIGQSVKFRKPEFRSTIFPMQPNLIKDTSMIPLIEEVLKVVGISINALK
ncbi:conjugal transfer protein TraA [Adhaeribacter aerolatus]|uniref:Conjugal transfer protein TraA n=1 Tax=Adhaeribacter aerolatus TaxID=670289 RepID=A0A512B0M4_9BACT|nr:AAA family ATPase [Adhaeribacter aerolatus]GEO05511.1 conjugal transfer protein TraA [Adhaeribacter aerolatus]